MAFGRLRNDMRSAFVRTPPERAQEIVFNLLSFPDSPHATRPPARWIYDPTCGEGDLLEPFSRLTMGGALHLLGVEIAADRADTSRARLPGSTIVTCAVEAVGVTRGSVSAVVANPPYFLEDSGSRAEYRIIAEAGEALIPGAGVMVAILAARSAWDKKMVNHWCRHYERVRCWKFPDAEELAPREGDEGAFDRYSQIVVIGVRREKPLPAPEPAEQARLLGWKWSRPRKAGASPWAQGFAPPTLPGAPIEHPYAVMPAASGVRAELVVRRADDALLLHALRESGAQLTEGWRKATEWQERVFLEEQAMPPAGFAHLASLLLTGVMDGEVVQGPDGEHYVFTSFVTQRWVRVQLDEEVIEEQRKKGVVALSVEQQEDHAVLGVLTLSGPGKGELRYLQGEAVFAFLEPWLSLLAELVLGKYQPIYKLDPTYRQALICAQIGRDKQLPGAAHPGLSDSQIHRVCAMERVLMKKGFVAIQGEPGTGKTRQVIALMARFADEWSRRGLPENAGRAQPRWMQGLRRAWRHTPRLLEILEQRAPSRAEFLAALAATCPPAAVCERVGLRELAYCFKTGPDGRMQRDKQGRPRLTQRLYWDTREGVVVAPRANPDLLEPGAPGFLVSAPRRTLATGWVKEIRSAWPEAEVLVIEDHLDVQIWLQRCAQGSAPAVVALFPHSLTRAFGREWKPAVLERKEEVTVADLEPEDRAVLADYQPVCDEKGVLHYYQHVSTGATLTRQALVSHFYCPACQGLIRAVPKGGSQARAGGEGEQAEDEEADRTEPVTSLTYFAKKPRWCECERQDRLAHRPRRDEGASSGDDEQWRCGAALWSETRVAAARRKYPSLPFREHAAVTALLAEHRREQESRQAQDGHPEVGKPVKWPPPRSPIALSEVEQMRRRRRAELPDPPAARLAPMGGAEAQDLLERLSREAWLSSRDRRALERFLAPEQERRSRVLELLSAPQTLIALVAPTSTPPEGYQAVRAEMDGDPEALVGYSSPTGPALKVVYSRTAGGRSRHSRPVGLLNLETGEEVLATSYYRLIAPPPDSFSPYDFLHRFCKGAVALSTIDESHNARGRSTDIAQSIHFAQLSAQTYVYASGTHYGGALDGFFFYWFRFNPQFWLRLGLTWHDVEKAVELYGVVQHWSKEYESDARRGSGATDVRESTIPAPGISARLIPYLLACIVYISVLDVGAFMPDREEIPDIVPMEDPSVTTPVDTAFQAMEEARRALEQAAAHHGELRRRQDEQGAVTKGELEESQRAEAQARLRLGQAAAGHASIRSWALPRDLDQHYRDLAETLDRLARQRNPAARMAQGTVTKFFAALPCTSPHFQITQVTRDSWGDITGQEVIVTTPVLSWEHTYPLELRLIDILKRELDEGRRIMVYFEQNDIRSMAERLQWVIKEAGLSAWVLPNSTEAEDREEAIRQAILTEGYRIVIVPYRRVSEGLNLQDVVDSIVWYEMAMNLFTLDQASRRAWRLGKTNLVRIYYLVYARTAAYRKLRNLGSRSGAASAFSGEPPKGALIEKAGANKTTLARLSLGLEGLEDAPESIEEAAERLRANFQRRGEELRQALRKGRQWFGVEDKLPGLLQAIRAYLADERELKAPPDPDEERPALSSQVLSLPPLPGSAGATVGAQAAASPAYGTGHSPGGATEQIGRVSWIALSNLAREEKDRVKRERCAARTRRKEERPSERAAESRGLALTLFDLLAQAEDAAAADAETEPVVQLQFSW